MIIEIKKNERKLGVINLSLEGKLFYVGEPDPELKSLLEALFKNGVERLIDIPDEERLSLTIIEQKIVQTGPNFSIALREHLERLGYEVTERHPEVEEEIIKLLSEFPDDNLDKKDILKRLPEMSYLEQTTIREGLLALNNTDNKLE